MPYHFCLKKEILLIVFSIISIHCYSQTNVANSYLSGGNARVVEIAGINGASVFGSNLTADCFASWEPQGVLCNSSNANSQTNNIKTNNESGATWILPLPITRTGNETGVLVIDLGSSQLMDLLQVYQMFSDGKATSIQFFAHPSKTLRPTHINQGWVSMGPEVVVSAGAITGNTVTQPTDISVTPVRTRFLKIHVKNVGIYGDSHYIELRNIKTFATAPTTQWNTQIYTGDDKTLASLQVTGSNLLWYTSAVGGSTLPITINLVDETTYYASQTVNGIESISRLPVKVKRISENLQSLLPGSMINNLTSTPSTGSVFTYSKWYATAVGGNRLSGNEILNAGTYYVEQYSEGDAYTISGTGSGLSFPYGVAVDGSGTIYVADLGNDSVKKISSNGSSVQNIGSGFSSPTGIAVDNSGNVYVADYGNNAIKKKNYNSSSFQTLGNGFSSPYGIAVDATGIIYVTDSNGVKKMNNDGTNIQALGNGFNSPSGIAVDTSGIIYVTDNSGVKKMNNDGTNIQILTSGFGSSSGIAVDVLGNIYVTGVYSNSINVMNNDGSNIHSLDVLFNSPYGVTLDALGDIYIADTNNNAIERIRNIITSNRVPVDLNILPMIPPETSLTTQVYTGDDKTIAHLQITGNNILWYDALVGGNLINENTVLVDEATYYASQTIGGLESNTRTAITVKRISDETQFYYSNITVDNLISAPSLGATAQWFSSVAGGTALSGTDLINIGGYYVGQVDNENTVSLVDGFSSPIGIAVDVLGTVYFSDSGEIKKMNNDGTNIQILASGFSTNSKIAVDESGVIYIADTGNHLIKKMNNDGTNIQIIGSGFNTPFGIAVDASGIVYVADSGNNVVKRMNNDGTNIQVIGDGFNNPNFITVDNLGHLYVYDSNNNAIKRINTDGANIITIADELYGILGISIDNSGILYASKYGSNVVIKIISSTNIQNIGSGLNQPVEVTVDARGNVYVYDFGSTSIKKIKQIKTSNRVIVSILPVKTPKTQWIKQIYTGSDKTLADLQITGNNIIWYDDAFTGNILPVTTLLTDESTYYASQTINNIESSTRLSIKVNRISANSQTSASGGTILDLVSFESIETIDRWFIDATSETVLLETDLLDNEVYYVDQYKEGNTTNFGYASLINKVAINPQETAIYWTEGQNSGIIRKRENDIIQTLTPSGFNYFNGIAVDVSGNIYATDPVYRVVKKMNSDGTNIQTIASGFGRPIDIAVDVNGNVYVTDINTKTVVKMNSDGTNIQTIASGFENLNGIAVDASGYVYVSDGDVIKKIYNNGYIENIASGFVFVRDVAVDLIGNIYVTNGNNNTVVKMDYDGDNIQTIASCFECHGVVADNSGIIYVTERATNAVKKIAQSVTSNRVPVTINLNTLSTDNFNISNQITVYPNPVKSEVTINTNNLTNLSIEFFDINGRIITSQKLNNSVNTIDMSNFQFGIYLLKIKSTEGNVIKKVIKE